jgi:outer membrane protein assembly factor BamB
MKPIARILPALLGALLFGAIESSAAPELGGWPQWHGPSRTGHAAAGAQVPQRLSADVKPLWKISIGGGFSGPIASGGKLVFLDEQDGQETAHLLDASTGKEIWRAPYAESFGDEWGAGPRATPLIDGDRLYVQSCSGELRCLALADGKTIWRANFADFGAKFLGSAAKEGTASRRGNNGSGVIDGERFIVTVGSANGASLVCFDKLTGRVLWKSGNDEAAYSSLIIATLAGVKQAVSFNADALLGADFATGEILWRVPLKTNAKRHAATPVIRGDTVTVNSHTFGTICFQIAKDGAALRATELWANKSLKVNLASFVLVGGHLFGAGANKDFVCVDAATGAVKWSAPGFGRNTRDYASTIAIGNRLIVLTESGTLHLLEANPEKCVRLGEAQVCGDTWSFPAYADGNLIVRDRRELQCLSLAEGRAQ